MARRTTTKTPEQEEEYYPGLAIRRDKLENALGNIQGAAYDAHINLMIAEVQMGKEVAIPIGEGRVKMLKKEKHLADLKETITNSQRAATRIQRELDSLPKDEQPDDPDIQPEDDKD